jgi:hypothetical protein
MARLVIDLVDGSGTSVYLARKPHDGLLKSDDALEGEAHEVVLRHGSLAGEGEFERLRHGLLVAVELLDHLGLKRSHASGEPYSPDANSAVELDTQDAYYAGRTARPTRDAYYSSRLAQPTRAAESGGNHREPRSGECAAELGEDGEVGVKRDPIESPDAEREQ